ncbi:glycosyl transferase [Methyloradius palustris]|uniref:Glycosyl transferase n=1 Tax=Methyloradius palustris TaxID=2778876 RepID=A0A8D5JKU7_9PROT|nr:glycosyl transferase [Methyloradius palustris]
MLVVADNCDDDTAEIAKANGVEVIQRTSENQRGKGYALDFGVRYLEADPPDIVIIVDADCIVHDDALNRLAFECISLGRPIQALYLMNSPGNDGLKTKVAEFAWVVKNWVRPLGFLRLNLPCQLMGTGMAFPWLLLKEADLSSGHIVEDMKLGIDFARLSKAPHFCPDALVTSTFPINAEGVKSQRTRWEHGHLGMIVKEGPALLRESLVKANLEQLFMTLDMCVPPLAMLIILIFAMSLLGAVLALFNHQLYPWLYVWSLLVTMAISVILAWLKYGRNILSISHLIYIPFYVLSKIPLYVKFVVKRQVEWVRSRRD